MITVKLPHWSRWQQRPQDAGQMVEVFYCTDGDYLYRRIYDRTGGPCDYARREIDSDDLEKDMDVPNGCLPKCVGDWEDVELAPFNPADIG